MSRFALPKITLAITFACLVSNPSFASDLSLQPFGDNSPQLASVNRDITIREAPHVQNEFGARDVCANEEMDVWQRIRSGFGIPELKSGRVNKKLAQMLSQQEYLQRTMDRASRYLFYVVQELEIRGMPTELALLPFIESAYNPHAKSHANAAGIWQFIPSTGRHFKLSQSTLKDERQSILKSTDAALNYLQRLHNIFGDWHLALAAYNWGQGSVRNAIKKNRARGIPVSFNQLVRHMPAETRNYLPKLQALKHIISKPGKYGISLPVIKNRAYFKTVPQTQDMDVKVAAQLAELPVEEFVALNPQFGQTLITGNKNTRLLLPLENAEKFEENLNDLDGDKALSSWTSHEITEDRVAIKTIAQQFGVSPDTIRNANQIPRKMLLTEGSVILVPKLNNKDAPENIAPEIVRSACILLEHEVPVKKRIRVRVRKNDSLWKIARRYQVHVSQIKKWNKLHNNNIIAGKMLKLYVLEKRAHL